MLGQRDKYPIEEQTNQNQHRNDKAHSEPPNNETQAARDTEIPVEECEHLGPHCRRPDEQGFGDLHDSSGSS